MRVFLVLLVFFVCAQNAEANKPKPGYTVDTSAFAQENSEGDILYTDDAPPQWEKMLVQSEKIWGQYPNCPDGIEMKVVTSIEDSVIAKAIIGGCTIWVNTNSIEGGENHYYRDRCLTIAHEYGHLLGKEHTKGGLMAADTSTSNSLDLPECGPQPRPWTQLLITCLLIFAAFNIVQLMAFVLFFL